MCMRNQAFIGLPQDYTLPWAYKQNKHYYFDKKIPRASIKNLTFEDYWVKEVKITCSRVGKLLKARAFAESNNLEIERIKL